MHPAQSLAYGDLLTHMRSGRIGRRTFFERALGLGFSAAAAQSLLASCGDGSGTRSGKHTLYLIWQSEFDISEAYQEIVEHFNQTNRDGIHVTVRSIQGGTNDLTTLERNVLRAHSAAIDILSVDIVIVPEFASQQWIKPISESQWPLRERERYLAPPLQGCTFNGQLWAAPFRTDIGLLYYRADLVKTPPQTWEELRDMAQQILAKSPQGIKYGYVWQASQYEGLICNFDEVLHGYGGSILDPTDPTRVTVESPEAREALKMMVSWVLPRETAISPDDITTYTEEVTRLTWEEGEAVFMRNWPYVYGHARTIWPPEKVGIHALPYGGQHSMGHSSVGGWQLAVNSFIEPERQVAAWKFIQYMLGREAQELGARKASWLVTRKDIYSDPAITRELPLFKEIVPIIESSIPRPQTPRYEDLSYAIRTRLRQALNGASVEETLRLMAQDLEPVVQSSGV